MLTAPAAAFDIQDVRNDTHDYRNPDTQINGIQAKNASGVELTTRRIGNGFGNGLSNFTRFDPS